MNKNVTVEYWDIDFEDQTARFSLEDDNENASIVVDVTLDPQVKRRTCSVKRVIDCWYLSDYDNQRVEHTQIRDSEVKIIDKILAEEYEKYLGD